MLRSSLTGLGVRRRKPSSASRHGRLVQPAQDALQHRPRLLHRRPLRRRTRQVGQVRTRTAIQCVGTRLNVHGRFFL